MVLHNLNIVNDLYATAINITGGHIAGQAETTGETTGKHSHLKFNNAFAFPGLINSHDHLDFNLFPQLGDTKYKNYREWGPYIHANYANEIAAVLKVPVSLREDWGMIKNLLCGVTTVVNHGEKVQTTNRPVQVYEHCQSLHSVGFEKKWRLKLNNPLKRKLPVVIHAGEGIDRKAHSEINQLIKWNLLRRQLIGIHGVAMSPSQAKKFRALVWCPQSNEFLLGETAPVDKLANYTNILFGTDSALTGSWDIWKHIRDARHLKLLSDEELYHSLNATAAQTWNLPSGEIQPGRSADIVITRNKDHQNSLEAYFSTAPKDILAVLCNGRIMLFDEEILPQIAASDLLDFSKIYLGSSVKYIRFDVPKLIKDIRAYYPAASFPVTENDYAFA